MNPFKTLPHKEGFIFLSFIEVKKRVLIRINQNINP